MPNCRSCGTPIIFLTTEPDGKFDASKPTPIDIDPARIGSIAIYESPDPHSVYPKFRDFKGKRTKYYRRLEPEAARMFAALGGALYSVHFESCPARR